MLWSGRFVRSKIYGKLKVEEKRWKKIKGKPQKRELINYEMRKMIISNDRGYVNFQNDTSNIKKEEVGN